MENGSCDIGLIGLAVMGQNLVLNMNDHGFKVAVFNRTVSKVDDFIAERGEGHAGRGRALGRGDVQAAEAASPRDDHGEGRRGGRPDDRACAAVPGEGRHRHRRRQLAVHGLEPPHQGPCGEGHSVHRHRRLRRRRRRALRPIHHARRQHGSMAAREADLPGHRREGRRRHSVLRLGGRGRRRPLREDGAQRHRVRRHAADRRGVPAAEGRAGPQLRTSWPKSSPSGTRASSTAI